MSFKNIETLSRWEGNHGHCRGGMALFIKRAGGLFLLTKYIL